MLVSCNIYYTNSQQSMYNVGTQGAPYLRSTSWLNITKILLVFKGMSPIVLNALFWQLLQHANSLP